MCCLIQAPCPLTKGPATLFKFILIDHCLDISMVRFARTWAKVSSGGGWWYWKTDAKRNPTVITETGEHTGDDTAREVLFKLMERKECRSTGEDGQSWEEGYTMATKRKMNKIDWRHEASDLMAETEEVSEEANSNGELSCISRRNKSSSTKAGHLTYWQSVLGLFASHLKWEIQGKQERKKGGWCYGKREKKQTDMHDSAWCWQ